MKYDYLTALYRRNNFGQPYVWSCEVFDYNTIVLHHGILGKTISTEYVKTNRNPKDEVKSRITAKRKSGYKLLNEVKDNTTLPVEGELYNYLDKYLPDHRTTIDGSLLPMLAKVYDNSNNKIFNKCSKYIGQYKINGLRCFISAEENFSDLFRPIRLKFQSREGNYWTSLNYLEDYLLSVIDQKFLMKMIDEHYILDGELYLPNHSVNEINHFVKDPNCPENKLLQYWCYDIAIENVAQYKRLEMLHDNFNRHIKAFVNKDTHYANKEQFIVLPTHEIINDDLAIQARNVMIDSGFEGLILRAWDKEYQFGKRNLSMIKFKKSTDGKFTILDIYPEGIKRNKIPLFLLKNDINDETFEVHVGGSHFYQKSILENKEEYIGKLMYVEYGERSGIGQVPFHVKNTYII